MYTIKADNGKFYIIKPDGSHLIGWEGDPLRYGKAELAETVVNRLNDPQPKKSAPAEVRGVMDNRHRNWRRRAR